MLVLCGLGRDDRGKIGAARVVLLKRQFGGAPGGFGSLLEQGQALAGADEGAHGVLGFLQCPQHRLFVGDEALLENGVLRAHGIVQPSVVEEGQHQRWRGACGEGVVREGVSQREGPDVASLESQKAADGKRREQRRLVDAYTRALGRRFLFRLPYIGPPAQEIRRDTYGYVQRDKGLGGAFRRVWHCPLRKRFPRCGPGRRPRCSGSRLRRLRHPARGQFRYGAGRDAEQHAQGIAAGDQLGFQLRDVGFRILLHGDGLIVVPPA